MSALALRATAIAVAALAPLFGACTVESSGRSGGGGGVSGYAGGAGSGGGTSSSSGSPSPQPMLVDVDANRTMTARPGQGVGVFTEYAAGGHWHAWWTCDTNLTGFDCSFDVTISTGDSITNVAGQALESTDQVSQVNPGAIRLITQTSTGIDGVTFDTVPGAIITLDAKMNGQDDGALLFFVQNGAVNGNYKGMLTDPLMLEPTTP